MILPLLLLSLQVSTSGAEPIVQPAAVKPAKPKLICETEEELGTRLGGKRVCRTKEQWDQIRSDGRKDLEDRQNHTNVNNK